MNDKNLFRNREKKRFFESELSTAGEALIHFDSRIAGVEVPDHLGEQPGVTLKFSTLFNTSPEICDEHIVQHLKFNGQYCRCLIPWQSVWAISGQEGRQKQWKDNIPPEIVKEAAKTALSNFGKKIFSKASLSPVSRKEPQTKVPPEGATKEDEKSKRRRSLLKRIK